MAEMDHILSLAKKYDLKILEDSSQAHGASYKNIKAGNWGCASATSLYPGKNLGALGDAGIITTNDENLHAKIKKLRNYGSHVRYSHESIGFNSRLDEIQAAFLRIKLIQLPLDNARRARIAQTYLSELKNTELILPTINADCEHVWHLFTVRHQKRAEIMQHLNSYGIESLIHYPTPPHLQKAYSFLNYSAGSFPISEKIHETIFSIPIDPTLTDDQVNYIIEKLISFF
jgi:dTDP-4-amino-4,6-dideoxygalactose transaminase